MRFDFIERGRGPGRSHLWALVMFVAFSAAAGSAAACDTGGDLPELNVVGAPDGATLILSSGDKLRLSGIQAPKLYAPGTELPNWPLAEKAQALLAGLAVGKRIALTSGRNARDRHGRLIGQGFLADGTWLQQAMVAAGLARAYSFPDTRECAAELLQAEAQARADGRGIWAEPFYRIRDAARPADLLLRAGMFELIEGRVLKADRVRELVYLNFGRFWKEDFTVTIDAGAEKLFAADGIDPLAFEADLIRVRGWVEDHDGPRIAVTHPEQIEVLALP